MKKLLFLLAVLLGFVSGIKAQVEPENDGIYYLYNEEAGLFLTRGENWGTQGVAKPVGLPWRVSVNAGAYTLRMYDLTVAGSTGGLGSNCYTDNGSPVAFTPEGNATDGYTLKNGDNYITCPANAGAISLSATASVWKFLTQAQYDAVLAAKVTAQDAAVAALKGIEIPEGKTLNDVVTDADNWASTTTNDGVPTSANWTATKHNDRGGNVNWNASYGTEMYQCGNGHYTRTISGLKPGIYKVSARGMKRLGNNATCTTMGNAGYPVSDTYLTANGNVIRFKAWYEDRVNDGNPNSTGDFVSIVNNGGYTTEGFTYVADDGQLVLDAASEAFWGGCWFLFNGISYTYYNNEVSEEDANAIIAQAEAISGAMKADVQTALTEALSSFQSAQTIANYNVLSAAVTAAQTSANAYAAGKAGLDELTEILANTNVYTAEAYANLGYDTALAAYNDGTWANEEAASFTNNILGNRGWRATVGIDDFLISAFDEGPRNWGSYHINTWSVEGDADGSNMTEPFLEYWTGDGNKLADKLIHAQMTGLPHGIYTVSALVRLRLTNNETAPVSGLSLDVNGGEASAVSGELNYGSFYVTPVQAIGKVGVDGVLNINFNVAGANSSWVAIKNVKYERTGDLDPSEFRAEVATRLITAVGLLNSVMNATAEQNLSNAVAATAGYEESSDIEALIAMAANLDVANAAAQTSVANYEEAAAVINAASILDEAGQTAYAANETVAEVKAAYEARTLDAVSDEQKTACKAALVAATKAQTSDNANWSPLIANYDFEGSYVSQEQPKSDRDIYQPEGWTVVWSSGESNDMTSLNSSCTSWNQFESKEQPADGGNNVYWARFRWGSSSSIKLSQNVTLPAGVYQLNAEGYLSAASATATLSVSYDETSKTANFTEPVWGYKDIKFLLNEEKTVEIAYTFAETATAEQIAGVDNFSLTYLTSPATIQAEYDAINALIARANAVGDEQSSATKEATDNAVAIAQQALDNGELDMNVLTNVKGGLQTAVEASEASHVIYATLATAEALAADDDAVAVGKLRDAIDAFKALETVTDEDVATLQAAIDQFNADNADQESDQTAKVAVDGWKKFEGNDAAGVCGTQYAPAINTYDGRTNVNLRENYESTAATTGQIIYQNITGLTNGTYKVGFYANAFFTSGRGFDSDMADGAEDVAYVFANDQQEFIVAHIATSTTENNFRQFDVEVTDGTIKLGMGKAKAGTNWHSMQIYQLTWFTSAKALYALDKAEMAAAITKAEALNADAYKTNGKEEFAAAIEAAQAAQASNKLNIAEFEAAIAALNAAIDAFKAANYVAFDGKYYVKNADGKYMAAGHAWGTRGIVNAAGLDLTLTADESKKVKIDSRVSNGGESHFLSDGLYMDGGAFAWAIEQIGAEEYSIGNGAQYIGVDENDNLAFVSEPYAWQFIDAATLEAGRMTDGLAAMAEATADNGVDATFLLKDADFNRNDQRQEAWTVEFVSGNNKNLGGGCDGGNGNGNAESYHSAFNIYQTIANAPAGVYKLTAQGFYRQDDNVVEAAPVFYIGDATAEVPVKTGDEGSMKDASYSFTEGKYTIDPIEFTLNEDGALTVGVKNGENEHQWVIFDNFRLTYYGPAPAPVKYAITVADTENGTVVADKAEAEEGETVTLTATPAANYQFASAYYMLNEEKVDITIDGNTASFAMPAAAVNVIAAFEPKTDYTDYIVNANLTGTDPKGFDDAGTKFIDGSGIVKASSGKQYDFKQTISLPAGQYKLTAQAAYRFSGSEADEAAAIVNGETTKFASLYATIGEKTVSTLVQNRYDGASETDYAAGSGSVVVNEKYVPNSSSAVQAWFNAGQYVNEVTFNLTADGDVTIGIAKDAQPAAGDYTVIGPWTLTRLGDPVTMYAITVGETENGSVSVDKTEAASGETVTVTVTPDAGYELDFLGYSRGMIGVVIPVENNVGTFTMPADAVTVNASFKEVEDLSYKFVPSEWIAGDAGRIAPANVVADDEAGTITVDKSGANNVALLFRSAKTYEVKAEQRYFVIKATGLSTGEAASYLWWLNNTNNGSQIAPTSIYEEEGKTVFAWDCVTIPIGGKLGIEDTEFTDQGGWSTTFGMTLADDAVPAVISYIGFQESIPEPVEEFAYEFVPSEWVAGDAGRISPENVTADDDMGTITVNKTGDNNVNLNFKTSKTYYVENIEYFYIKAKGISTEEGKSYLWWLNGKNDNGAQVAPTHIKTEADGTIILEWRIDECGNIGENINATGRSYLAGGDGLNTTFGLTQADDAVPVVITEIGYSNDSPTGISSIESESAEGALKDGKYLINGKIVIVKNGKQYNAAGQLK